MIRKTCHSYAQPYGSREIHRDGKPFVNLDRVVHPVTHDGPPPVDVDDFARLCGKAPALFTIAHDFVADVDADRDTYRERFARLVAALVPTFYDVGNVRVAPGAGDLSALIPPTLLGDVVGWLDEYATDLETYVVAVDPEVRPKVARLRAAIQTLRPPS